MPYLLRRRLKRRKESAERLPEKLGRYTLSRAKGQLIWFHVASVGELNSIVPLVKLLEDKHNVLITTVTLNASLSFEKAGFKRAIHQFAPLDTPQIVQRFLNYWQPSVGVFIDSELWPNLLTAASSQFKVINLNARLSDKSASRWSYLKGAASYLYGRFSLILPCSDDDMRKIGQFVAPSKLRSIGNLKMAANTMEAKASELKKFQKLLAIKLVIVAASTHEGEEEIVASAFASLLASHPEAILIIAPRNPARGAAVLAICESCGLEGRLRSRESKPASGDCVFIADSIGEMGLWYSIASIVIVGGSLIPHGGHNVVEPAKLHNAIVTGPYTHNFRDIISYFAGHQALVIASKDELESALLKLANNEAYREALADKAMAVSSASGVLDAAVATVLRFLNYTKSHL